MASTLVLVALATGLIAADLCADAADLSREAAERVVVQFYNALTARQASPYVAGALLRRLGAA